jgi:hypothetical protein
MTKPKSATTTASKDQKTLPAPDADSGPDRAAWIASPTGGGDAPGTVPFGPEVAIAAISACLGQTQAQTVLFAKLANQQALQATLAAVSLTQAMTRLFASRDGTW